MAEEELFTVFARDFEYQVGYWERPRTDGIPAKLQFGDRIETTVAVDASDLGNTGAVYISFKLAKPKKGESCFGWRNSQLEFKAVLGNKSATFTGLGKKYNDMAAGAVAHFRLELDLSGNTNPIHNKLKMILSDRVATLKSGLHFYEARVIRK